MVLWLGGAFGGGLEIVEKRVAWGEGLCYQPIKTLACQKYGGAESGTAPAGNLN